MRQHAVRMVDFHGHYEDESWFATPDAPGKILAASRPLLLDLAGQLVQMDAAGIDTRVLSAPASMLNAPGEPMPLELMRRVNDRLAELVDAHAGRFLALATIDVFQGEIAAREVERALHLPGIGGIVVDCAQGERFLDFPRARPALEAAASLGAPVFVHPVSPAGLTERLARLGHTGVLLARGTEDAASLLALLRSGLLDELPDLHIVLPMIGAAVFLFAGLADLEFDRDNWQGARPALARTRLYVDTMGFDPVALRFVIDLLGPEHILLGSDWPIMPLPRRQQVEALLATQALTSEQRVLIMSGNAERLLRREVI